MEVSNSGGGLGLSEGPSPAESEEKDGPKDIGEN
jgi:hypothetical protein